MNPNFSPSMMCADFSKLAYEMEALEQCEIDSYHIDFMDGYFVNNLGMGLQDLNAIKKLTKKPLYVHLMMQYPERLIGILVKANVHAVYVHVEAESNILELLQTIRCNGIKPCIAINPGTSIENKNFKELLHLVEEILVMSVNPGFAGQKFIPSVDSKIKALIKLKDKYNFTVSLDGSCSQDVIVKYSKLGVDGFVLGTSVLFEKNNCYNEIMSNLRLLTSNDNSLKYYS